MDELELLRRVETEARAMREPCGYDGGASSEGLNDALKALDEWRTATASKPVSMCVKCGYPHVAHGRNVFACGSFLPHPNSL